MRLRDYASYFHFLWRKFDLRIARHAIKHEIRGEKKYGINSSGVDSLKSLRKKGVDLRHSAIYMPASYDLIEEIFSFLAPEKLNCLLDLGCGKGRVMCVAAEYGFRKAVGVELSKQLASIAKLNLAKTKLKHPYFQYEVVNNDAFYFEIPKAVDCIFLFNPFDDVILSGVLDNLKRRLKDPKKLFVVYVNPIFKEMLIDVGFREVRYKKKLEYLEYSILRRG